MQKIAYQSLRGYQGAIIVIDPQQGQIYTLASRPSYDPNRIVTGKSQKIKSDFLNRCIQASYPLGSVFKPLVAITALDNDVIAANKKVFCPGYFKIANSRFNCWSEHGHQDMIQAITHSCNVYFYKLGLKLGIKELSQVAHQFGFGGLTGVDLPYEGDGIVPSRQWKKDYRNQPWYTGDTVNTSIGQGYLQVTPLQATVAMAALANGGYTVKPHLLKAVNDLETTIISKDYLGISNQDLQVVRRGLRGVVAQTSGTAHLLDRLDLAIAGKTGTAQTSGPSHGWFVGYFPQDKPLFTFCVFLENAGSSHQAVRVAYRFLRNLKKAGIIGDNYE
jgi:penicillin-binding protein 2